jgi:hypothetical protein
MRNHTAALVLVAYKPLTPKSASFTVLSPVLLVLLTDSPLTLPCLFVTTSIYEELGRLERKPSLQSTRLQPQKVRFRCGVYVPAVSPRRRHDRRDASDRPCAIGASWHAAACSSVLRCVHARTAARFQQLIPSRARVRRRHRADAELTPDTGLLSLSVDYSAK